MLLNDLVSIYESMYEPEPTRHSSCWRPQLHVASLHLGILNSHSTAAILTFLTIVTIVSANYILIWFYMLGIANVVTEFREADLHNNALERHVALTHRMKQNLYILGGLMLIPYSRSFRVET
jgi:hypothetical protein